MQVKGQMLVGQGSNVVDQGSNVSRSGVKCRQIRIKSFRSRVKCRRSGSGDDLLFDVGLVHKFSDSILTKRRQINNPNYITLWLDLWQIIICIQDFHLDSPFNRRLIRCLNNFLNWVRVTSQCQPNVYYFLLRIFSFIHLYTYRIGLMSQGANMILFC